jgi:hypothetical protein
MGMRVVGILFQVHFVIGAGALSGVVVGAGGLRIDWRCLNPGSAVV